MELKGFQKIFLESGETRKVEFTINEETVKMYDINMDWVAEAGEFDVWLATSSDDKSNHLEFALVD
jgi:beta-glucosidase